MVERSCRSPVAALLTREDRRRCGPGRTNVDPSCSRRRPVLRDPLRPVWPGYPGHPRSPRPRSHPGEPPPPHPLPLPRRGEGMSAQTRRPDRTYPFADECSDNCPMASTGLLLPLRDGGGRVGATAYASRPPHLLRAIHSHPTTAIRRLMQPLTPPSPCARSLDGERNRAPPSMLSRNREDPARPL